MKVKKKAIIIPICVVLVICLVAGTVLTVMKMNTPKKTIEVVPVNMISTQDYRGYNSSYGNVTSDVSQTVYLESDATVQEIYVQEGDEVTVGTPIMQYDTTLMQLDIESKQMDIKKLDININQTNKDIQSLKKGVVPSGGGMVGGVSPTADVGSKKHTLTTIGMEAATDTQTTEPGSTEPKTPEPPVSDTPAPASGNPTTPDNTDSKDPAPEPPGPTDSESKPTERSTEETSDTPEVTDETIDTNATTTPTDTTEVTDTPEATEPTTESQTDESETTAPERFVEKLLDKDFDFSKYEASVDSKGFITIPVSPETKITVEFFNLLRGKNPDGTDVTEQPDPNDPEQANKPDGKIHKVKLQLEDEKYLPYDGEKLNEPFINVKEEFTIQEIIDSNGLLPAKELPVLDETFFETYPKAKDPSHPLLIHCTSETQLTPAFIYLLMGRNADGSEIVDGTPLSAHVYLTDMKETITLDGTKLALPYVTSIDTPIALFIENKLELAQEPVKELDKDTVLDPSKDHREVYEIYCDDSTIITKDFINRIRDEKITVVLKIEGHASWITLDGSLLEEPSEKAIDTPLNEFIANGIALNEEIDETGGGGGIDIGGGGGDGYTADDIKKMLGDKQLELAKLQTQRKQAELDLTKLQQKLSTATVTSTITGIVTTAVPLDENTSTSEPFIVISSTEGLYLTGNLNELKLETLSVGQKISALSWRSGTTFDATIREISPYPTSTSNNNYGNNPNSSEYPFIAYIENPEGLREGEGVDIMTDGYNPYSGITNTENMPLYIAKAYVREEDDGRSYVYMANSEGLLEKKYVTTGKILQSVYVEIKDKFITQESYLAFPYGDIKEGYKTKIMDSNDYDRIYQLIYNN